LLWLIQTVCSRVSLPQNYFGLAFLLLLSGLVGCVQATPATPGAVYRAETVVLPTGGPTPKPTPLSTRVIPLEALTPAPTPTITPLPDEVRALVVDIIDGDTITVVMDGDPPGLTYTVRYLGIDAPPNTASIPWGRVAFETNRKLTNGRVVQLERDQTDADSDGNLLRYVFLDDALLSITLAEQGLARANIVEPDTRFQAEILEAEGRARTGQLGLWSNRPPTATPRPAVSPTTALTETVEPAESTAQPEATGEITPAATSAATTEPETTATGESEVEPTAETLTPEPTGEVPPGSDSSETDLQGPD
jgi:endonuclease YncB( thermonuclease family)